MTSAPTFDSTLPPTASPRVEFISLSHLNPSTELNPVPSRGIDLAFFRRYVRSLEEGGYDYTLLPYGSGSADSFVTASAVGQLTERLRPIVALRPNTTFPTVGAQKLATLDQLTRGPRGRPPDLRRQRRRAGPARRLPAEGPPLRADLGVHRHPAQIVDRGGAVQPRRASSTSSTTSGPASRRTRRRSRSRSAASRTRHSRSAGPRPTSSASGASRWTTCAARSSGSTRSRGPPAATTFPRIWVTFRPIVAATDELAWAKAHEYVAKIAATFAGHAQAARFRGGTPQNKGSQRALAFAGRSRALRPGAVDQDRGGDQRRRRLDRAGRLARNGRRGHPRLRRPRAPPWCRSAATTPSPTRWTTAGYMLPLVRQEIAHRQATGQRGSLQAEHLGNYGPRYREYAAAGSPSCRPDCSPRDLRHRPRPRDPGHRGRPGGVRQPDRLQPGQ